MKARAEKLRDLVRREFGLRCVVGVGRAVAPGDRLMPSWEDALTAMHAAVQLDREILFYGQKDLPARRYAYGDLRKASGALAAALASGASAEARPAADHYVRVLLEYSSRRLEVARGQCLAVMSAALEQLHKRLLFSEQDLDDASRRLGAPLEQAMSLAQLIESFKLTLARLLELADRARGGPRQLRMESTLQYLQEHYRETLRLPQVARMAGYSVAAFSRAFKEATGTSFAAYLRGVRVEEAKRLLRSSGSPVVDVAHRTGFQSSHRLIRAFKQQSGMTPGEYREKNRV